MFVEHLGIIVLPQLPLSCCSWQQLKGFGFKCWCGCAAHLYRCMGLHMLHGMERPLLPECRP